MTNKYEYFEVSGVIDGQREVLFGSYNPGEVRYELQVEKLNWRHDGYQYFQIDNKYVDEAPDREVYPELYNSGGQVINM